MHVQMIVFSIGMSLQILVNAQAIEHLGGREEKIGLQNF